MSTPPETPPAGPVASAPAPAPAHPPLAKVQAGSGASGGSSSAPSATATKIAQALVQQRSDTTYLTWVAVFFFVGAIIPVIVLPPLLKKLPRRPPVTHSRGQAVRYTVIITGLTTVGTYYFLDHPKLVAGSFFVAAVLVLTQVGDDIEWKMTFQRVLGTIGGMLVLSVVLHAVGTVRYTQIYGIPMPMRLYVVGLVFGAAAIVAKFSPRQWIYFALIAPAAAMMNAFTATQATDLGRQRLIDNVVGSVLVIAATLVTIVGSKIAERPTGDGSDAPTPTPPTSPALPAVPAPPSV